MKLFFDGGCRPAGMEWAVVARGQLHLARDLGPGDSMTAEWLALIAAVRIARDLNIADAVLLGDAKAVIAQASGAIRCPPAHQEHLAAFLAARQLAGGVRMRYVSRRQNLAGIALARLYDGAGGGVATFSGDGRGNGAASRVSMPDHDTED